MPALTAVSWHDEPVTLVAQSRRSDLRLSTVLVQALRVVLVAVFVIGGAAEWALHPHTASAERLEQALAAGEVRSYSLGREDDERHIPIAREHRGAPTQVFWRDSRGVLWMPERVYSNDDGGADAGTTTVLTPSGTIVTTQAVPRSARPVVARLQRAGVPYAPLERTWAAWLEGLRSLAWFVGVLWLVFGTQPRRMTKWAWFWTSLIPGGFGMLAWLAFEAPWSRRASAWPQPQPHHRQMYAPGGDRRMTGGTGFLFLIAGSIAVALVLWAVDLTLR